MPQCPFANKYIWFDTIIGLDALLRLEKWCCRYIVVTAEEVGIHGCDCLAGQDGNFCKHRAAVLLRKGLSPVEKLLPSQLRRDHATWHTNWSWLLRRKRDGRADSRVPAFQHSPAKVVSHVP